MNSPIMTKIILDNGHRAVSLQETYEKILPLMHNIGPCNIVDLTDYDSLSIPVYAIQHAYTTEWLGYGKGITALQSQVSALMEAIERYTVQQLPSNHILSSYEHMRELHHVLLPSDLVPGSDIKIAPDIELEWLVGTDLLSNTKVWVPAAYVVLSPDLVGPTLKKWRTSNGTASGNTFDEAVCHGLYELVERDAWTLAWLQSITVPQMQHIAQEMRTGIVSGWDEFTPRSEVMPLIAVESLPETAQNLLRRFQKAGVKVVIRNITSDIGVSTFLAAGSDERFTLCGMGTHLSSEVALIRAITECAQLFQIKRRLDMKDSNNDYYNKIKKKLLFETLSNRSFHKMLNYQNDSIIEDIHMLLSFLRNAGMKKIIAIDITDPVLQVPVVRLIVPGIEDWSVYNFSPDFCQLGYRGQKYIS